MLRSRFQLTKNYGWRRVEANFQNVACFCNVINMDNAANYVVARRMLMERHPTLFWTPCTAHCIDLMLDIWKFSFVKNIIDSSKRINNLNFETGTDTVTRFVEIAKKWPDFEKGWCRMNMFFLEHSFWHFNFFYVHHVLEW